MITAFEHALLPLFPAASKQASRQKLQNALHSRSLRTDTVPWQIEVLSPTPAAFDDFADPSSAIENHGALATINSNYQHEQDQARRKQGRARSEQRRVGKECVRTCRHRGSRANEKKKKKK